MAKSVAVASGTADVQGVATPCVLLGICVRENAGTPAAAGVILRDGTSATDPIRVPIKLAANGCIIGGLPAVTFATGIFVDRESGTTELVLYIME